MEQEGLKSIIESADRIKFKIFDSTTLGRLSAVNNNLDRNLINIMGFAEPDALMGILSSLGLETDFLSDSPNVDKIKFIYNFAKNNSEDFLGYLDNIGNKIGGRFTKEFFDRIFTYISILDSENRISKKYKDVKDNKDMISKERKSYEKNRIK